MKRLIVDTSNLLFRVAAAHNKYSASSSAEDHAGLAMHSSLNTLKSFYKKIKPDQVALAFEGPNNWRKDYTKSGDCLSRRIYKANRVKDDSMIPFYELIKNFEQLARLHTSLVCLSAPTLEGDDVIAGYAQHFSAKGDQVVILSGDKDFMQLLKLPGVTLVNPDDGKERVCDDAEYFMFEKAIRGDAGDNVMSAFPRVRSTKIQEAYKNEYARTNFMNSTWEFNEPTTGEKRIVRVGDMFEENMKLMNLFQQPEHIRQLIQQTIEREVREHGQFSLFHFQKFCGKYKLKKISEEVTQFVEMFSSTGLNSPHKEETKAINAEKRKVGLVF